MSTVIQLASGATEADIHEALSALTEGGTVILPPDETIDIGSGLNFDVAHRNITIDLNGGTLRQAANVSVVTARAIHTPMEQVALGQSAAGNTTVTYADLPEGLAPGSWIKVVSDNTLPGDHLDAADPTRMGQALQVVSVDGNTATLAGSLVDQSNYRTNVRATEYVSGDLVITNGEIAGNQNQAGWNSPLIQLRGLVEPKVEQVSIHDGVGKGIGIVDTVNASITDVTVKNLNDAPGALGIAVHSLSSTGTTVTGLYAENVTHAADANAIGNAANSASAAYYGGDIGMSVQDSVAYATRNFAFSWHSEVVNAHFDQVLAFNSHGFLNARGIGNTITDSGGVNNQRGIILYEWGDGDARNLTIDSVTLKETLHYSTIALNEPRDNRIIDSWFEAYGYTGPVSEVYATTTGTTYIRIDPENESDVIAGSLESDLLLGGKGDDLITGDAGDDYILGGAGIDTLLGGADRDRFAFHDLSEAGDVIGDFEGGLQGDVIDLSVMRARLNWTGDDLIAAKNLRWMQSGDDVLVQVNSDGEGDDFTTLATLTGISASSLSEANFVDRLSEAGALRPPPTDGDVSDGVREGTPGDDVLYADALSRHLRGWDGNDLLYADANDAWLEGGAGNDTLVGHRGNDLLDGGTDDDWMGGGAGDDVYIVDSAADVVSEGANAGFDTIRTAIDLPGPLADNVEALSLLGDLDRSATGNGLDNVLTGNIAANTMRGGSGADLIDGSAGEDTLYGEDDGDVLEGGAGFDRLDGGAGNDLLQGGADADRLIGSSGYDTISYDRAAEGVVADLTDSGNNAGAAAGDVFSSTEHLTGGVFGDTLGGNQTRNTLDGGAGDDRLLGLGGGDTIGGGDGNDFIDGGALKDVVSGGAGDDTFYFASVEGAGDRIADFSGGDSLALSGAGFGLSDVLDFQFSSFVTGEVPQLVGSTAAVTYDSQAGFLGWDADGADSGQAVFIGALDNAPALTHSDFLIV